MTPQLGNDRLAILVFRNHILCTIKNVGDWPFALLFLLVLPIRALRPLLHGDSVPWRASWAAAGRIPLAILKRSRKRGSRRNPFAHIASAVARPVPQASAADSVIGS